MPSWISRLGELRRSTHGPAAIKYLLDKLNDDGVSGLPDLEAAAEQYASAGLLWQGVHGGSVDEGTVRAAHRIGLIYHQDMVPLLRQIRNSAGQVHDLSSPLSGYPEQVEEEVLEATLDHQLVIVNGDVLRHVYWGEDLIPTEWNTYDTAWQFLWALVRARMHGRQLDSAMLGPDASDSRLRDWRRRLNEQLNQAEQHTPAAAHLNAVILPGNRAGTYMLNLERSEVWARRFNGDVGSLERIEAS
jgi:hypothetical protein